MSHGLRVVVDSMWWFVLFVFLITHGLWGFRTQSLRCYRAYGISDDLQRSSECQPALREGLVPSTVPVCIYDLVECVGDRCVRAFRFERTTTNSSEIKLFIQPAYCFVDDSKAASEIYCGSDHCSHEIQPGALSGSGSCCCSTDGCNRELQVFETIAQHKQPCPAKNHLWLLMLIPAIAVVIAFSAYLYCQTHRPPPPTSKTSAIPSIPKQSATSTNQLENIKIGKDEQTHDVVDSTTNSPLLAKSNNHHQPPQDDEIELLELRARGRFGCVHKAFDKTRREIVAVKVFAQNQDLSWLNEQRIYRMASMKVGHPGILKFINAQHLRLTGEMNEVVDQYRIVSEYHERGSLFDLLKSRTVTEKEMLKIAVSMAAGLSYMHQSSTTSSGEVVVDHKPAKPSIAHRDFKSKNVLIKSDMSACVADMGLALVLDHHLGEIHSQVGTPRYMAPEVLEGAISFTPAAFLCIDAFAFALVLWELLSRIETDEKPSDFLLPFEDLVGSNPSVMDMNEIIVNKKQRPSIPEAVINNNNNKTAASIVETMVDCWDHDADSRLTVMCAYVRLRELADLQAS